MFGAEKELSKDLTMENNNNNKIEIFRNNEARKLVVSSNILKRLVTAFLAANNN